MLFIEKVLLKAVLKSGKGSKLFTAEELVSWDETKHAILDQLQDNVVNDFHIGLIVEGNVITIHSTSDLKEFWSDVESGKKVMLFCKGLKDTTISVN